MTPSNKLKVATSIVEKLRKLHPDLKKKIRAGLEAIVSDPLSGKALKQELAGLRSFRVQRFRIIYRILTSSTLEIVAIGPRKNVYLETYRLMKNKG